MTIKITPLRVGISLIVILAFVLVYLQWPMLKGLTSSFRGGSEQTSGSRDIVVVDVSRILNAQRQIASTIMSREGDASQNDSAQAMTLSRAGRMTNRVIREVAGPTAIVLVKQAVVSFPGDMPDITPDVLSALELPSDAPSNSYSYNAESGRLPSRMTSDPEMSEAARSNDRQLQQRLDEYERNQDGQNAIP